MKTLLQILSNWIKPHLPAWLKFDKLMHFLVSLVSTFIEMQGINSFSHTFFGGIAWELCDWKHGKFEWLDVFVNWLGIIAGIGLHYIFNIL